ncbi:MAG: dihydrofolate reductase family protein [Verrucomicrobia bacterium]|nr:dihydrofolate reductase family protein [Verrucomicrobiota bacterium]
MKRAKSMPFTFINVAMTADGKIAPANRQFVPFGSKRDHELLLELRATADAVMSGARTVDAFPVNMGPGGKKYRDLRVKRGLAENNLRIIVSGSGSIDPEAEIFKHHFSPIIILTTERAPQRELSTLRSLGAEIKICGAQEVDFNEAFRWLRKEWKVKRLLSEGGGEVNDALFRANLVDEVYVTLCPFLFGGRNAPTLADGQGVAKLAEATKLKRKRMKRVGDELYMVYEVAKN